MSTFKFKQFEVKQHEVAQKITTDSTLLGAWSGAEGQTGLDVGTGCGILALMLAQRNPEIEIKAIEIDPINARLAKENFLSSPWSARLSVLTGDFLLWRFEQKFDLILSNPPYFSKSLLPELNRKAVARHDGSLPLISFFHKSTEILNSNGLIAIVLPFQSEKEAIDDALSCGLRLQRKGTIFTKVNFPKRVLLEFGRDKKLVKEEIIEIGDATNHNYSPYYQQLLRDFLLVIT